VTAWHLDADLMHRYVSGEIDFVLAASVESHILRCAQCRRAVAAAVPADRLDRIWDAVASRIDAPRARPVQRLLTRRTMPRSRPSWRPSWSSCRAPRMTGIAAVLGLALGLPTRLLNLATAAARRCREVLAASAQPVARLPGVSVPVQAAARTGIAVLIAFGSVAVASTWLSPPKSPLADPPHIAQPRILPPNGPPDRRPAPSQATTSAARPSTPAASRSSDPSTGQGDQPVPGGAPTGGAAHTSRPGDPTATPTPTSSPSASSSPGPTSTSPVSGVPPPPLPSSAPPTRPPCSAGPLSGCPVEVNATATSYSVLSVVGVTNWLDARTVQHLMLVPGPHAIETAAATAVLFRITDSGTVDYDQGLDGFLSGRGSSTLQIRGYPIEVNATVDATVTSYTSFAIFGVGWLDARVVQPLRLVPGRHIFWTPASTGMPFTVANAGTVSYEATFDGFLSGRDSSTLRIRGYPIEVDATATSYPSFAVFGVSGWLDARMVQPLVLVPGTYRLHVSGVPDALFRVTETGTIDYDDLYAPVLSGRGSTTLTVRNAAPPSSLRTMLRRAA